MGNEVPKAYALDGDLNSPQATGGPECLWKIYPATKRSTGEKVSLFVFEKDQLQKRCGVKNKQVREQVFEHMRRAVKNLSSLRHPSVLRVIEAFEEPSKAKTIKFAAEPVFASLANVQKDFTNLPANAVPAALRDSALSQFDICYGLLGVAQGLEPVVILQRRLYTFIDWTLFTATAWIFIPAHCFALS